MLTFMEGQGQAGDNAAADRNWMLLASALSRRFSDRQLQDDPRLRRVVADARWAASSLDAKLLVRNGGDDPRLILDARCKHFQDSVPPATYVRVKQHHGGRVPRAYPVITSVRLHTPHATT